MKPAGRSRRINWAYGIQDAGSKKSNRGDDDGKKLIDSSFNVVPLLVIARTSIGPSVLFVDSIPSMVAETERWEDNQ